MISRVDLLSGKPTQTIKRVIGIRAGSARDEHVVGRPRRSLLEACLYHGTSTLHDSSSEEAIVPATIGNQVKPNVPCTTAATPEGHFVRITAKGSNILLDPVQGKTLVS